MENTTEQTAEQATITRACNIALGLEKGLEAKPVKMTVAKKDYNSRGRCQEHWFRMVWRNGSWGYIGARLPSGNFLASDRRAEVVAEVYEGELVARHDRGGKIEAVSIIVNGTRKVLEFYRTRVGNLKITLPDGREIELPDPRK